MAAQSVSRDGNHVFQVPLLDPTRMPSSAGGFPWKIDDGYNTVVFIKNETDEPKRYVAHLLYDGGAYSLGVRDIKPGQTVQVDFKELRDNQTPDSRGNRIPLNVNSGQIGWTMNGADNKTLSGRSEQVNVSRGISSTYACYNCCPNNIINWWVEPGTASNFVGGSTPFTAVQQEDNCDGTQFGPYSGFPVDNWLSSYDNVAWVDNGIATGMGVGLTDISAHWYRVWYVAPNCGMLLEPIYGSSPMQIVNVSITRADGSALPSILRLGISATTTTGVVHNRKQSLKATVTPAEQAGNVTIEVSSKVTISNIQRSGGVITFDVVGNAASSNSGDSVIRAKHLGTLVTHQPISVVVPSKVATPHDTTGTYIAANRVLDPNTSPADHSVSTGNVGLWTVYMRVLTITVKDQFNNLVGDIYEGAEITETSGPTNVRINQSLTSSSTYSDPVGLGIRASVVAAGSSAANSWPAQPLQPMVSASANQNIPVQVDGFTLVPGIAARTWTATPPNTLTISWPN